MSILKRLKEHLDREKVTLKVLTHSESFTAPELAQALHVPGKELAKVVMVKADERFVMTVLSANQKVDLKRLREIFRTSHVRLATEAEFKELCPDRELGGLPPFGNLYSLEVDVDKPRTADEELIFQAGTRHVAIK